MVYLTYSAAECIAQLITLAVTPSKLSSSDWLETKPERKTKARDEAACALMDWISFSCCFQTLCLPYTDRHRSLVHAGCKIFFQLLSGFAAADNNAELMTTGVSLTRYKPKGNRNSNGPANIGPSSMVHFILVWVFVFQTDRPDGGHGKLCICFRIRRWW